MAGVSVVVVGNVWWGGGDLRACTRGGWAAGWLVGRLRARGGDVHAAVPACAATCRVCRRALPTRATCWAWLHSCETGRKEGRKRVERGYVPSTVFLPKTCSTRCRGRSPAVPRCASHNYACVGVCTRSCALAGHPPDHQAQLPGDGRQGHPPHRQGGLLPGAHRPPR